MIMGIEPASIEQSGAGVELEIAEGGTGISVTMADPSKDPEYARSAVTLTFDLSAFENITLSFEAK